MRLVSLFAFLPLPLLKGRIVGTRRRPTMRRFWPGDRRAAAMRLRLKWEIWPPERACQLAVFSGKLPSIKAEIDCELQSNSPYLVIAAR